MRSSTCWPLIAASIPLTAIVFVFGGVAPDDVLRGYIVLVVTALGFGALGLLALSLVKRTQAAIAISVFAVLFLSIGTLTLLLGLRQAMGSSDNGRGVGPINRSPPQALAYLNPFIAQVDVLCGTEVLGACAARIRTHSRQQQRGDLPDEGGTRVSDTDASTGRPRKWRLRRRQ